MSRYHRYHQADEDAVFEGDAGFVGVNQVDHPHRLQPGEVADALNCRWTDGVAEPRLGVVKTAWSALAPTSGGSIRPFGEVHGATVFRDPSDVEWMVIAADTKVYRTRSGAGAIELKLPVGVEITGEVHFTQTFNGLIMFRGHDLDELELKNLDDGFVVVAQEANTVTGAESENPTDGTETIPRAVSGEWIGNRLFIPYHTATEKDLLAISDYLNATRYQPVRAQGRINQGSSDGLTRFVAFNESTGVALKERSVYAVYGLQGNLSSMVLDEVTSEFGSQAPFSVLRVGQFADQRASMLWFLSEKRGISAITFGEFGRLQATAVPVSREIHRLVARINWRHAGGARSAWWDNKAYFAVPLDDANHYVPVVLPEETYSGSTMTVNVVPGQTYRWSPGAQESNLANGSDNLSAAGEFVSAGSSVVVTGTAGQAVTATLERVYVGVNNAILVYDFLRGKWAGYDQSAAISVKEFLKTTHNGVQRLFFVSADGWVNLYEDGFFDDVARENANTSDILLGSFDGLGLATQAVTPGQRYIYAFESNVTSLINGTETLTDAEGTFVAQSGQVELRGTASTSYVGSTMRPVEHTITPTWFTHQWLSRGYTTQSMSQKRFQQVRLGLESWHPKYTIQAEMDGQNEVTTLAEEVTRNPLKYLKPFNKANWDPTNINDDHGAPDREDYSVILTSDSVGASSLVEGTRYYVSEVYHGWGIYYDGTYVPGGATFVAGAVTGYVPANFLLSGAWNLEEAASATLYKDVTHNDNDLTQGGTVDTAAGKVGQAASFGAGDLLSIASNTSLMGSASFMMGAWVYFDATTGSARGVMSKGVVGSGTEEYWLGLTGTPLNIKFAYNNGGNQTVVDSGVTAATGTWYWVCVWFDTVAGEIGIQVNDNTPVTAAHGGGSISGANAFWLGSSGFGQNFEGRIDQAFFYRLTAGTASMRSAIYNGGLGIVLPQTESTQLRPPSVLAPGSYIFPGANGIHPNLFQVYNEQLGAGQRLNGKYVQLRVTNTQGRLRTINAEVEARRIRRRSGSHT